MVVNDQDVVYASIASELQFEIGCRSKRVHFMNGDVVTVERSGIYKIWVGRKTAWLVIFGNAAH